MPSFFPTNGLSCSRGICYKSLTSPSQSRGSNPPKDLDCGCQVLPSRRAQLSLQSMPGHVVMASPTPVRHFLILTVIKAGGHTHIYIPPIPLHTTALPGLFPALILFITLSIHGSLRHLSSLCLLLCLAYDLCSAILEE